MEWLVLNSKIQITDDSGNTTEGMVTDYTKTTVDFSIPSDDINFKLFHQGEKIEALVITKNKGVRFKGVILSRVRGDIPTYHLGQLSDFVQAQRRENVRVMCSDVLHYISDRKVVSSLSFMRDISQAHDRVKNHLKEAVMMDLSAGGLRFSSGEKIDDGQQLILQFPCKDENMILRGTVVHIDLLVKPTGIRYFYGIRFDELEPKIEDKIINHVFLKMRNSRKI